MSDRIESAGGWRPIETAPRDGSVVEITALEDDGTPFEIHPMCWDANGRNTIFAPGMVGMWTAPDGSYTWREGDGGPTHWRPAGLLTRRCAGSA